MSHKNAAIYKINWQNTRLIELLFASPKCTKTRLCAFVIQKIFSMGYTPRPPWREGRSLPHPPPLCLQLQPSAWALCAPCSVEPDANFSRTSPQVSWQLAAPAQKCWYIKWMPTFFHCLIKESLLVSLNSHDTEAPAPFQKWEALIRHKAPKHFFFRCPSPLSCSAPHREWARSCFVCLRLFTQILHWDVNYGRQC